MLLFCPSIFGRLRRGKHTSGEEPIHATSTDRLASRADSEDGTLVVNATNKNSGTTTPTAESIRADAFVREVLGIHARLRKMDSLAPGPVVNSSLTKLVGMCCEVMPSTTVRMIMESPSLQAILPNMRVICGTAECELEAYWAAKIINLATAGISDSGERSGASPSEMLARLAEFPYYRNYTELTRLELCAMCAARPAPPRRIAFIGSGPLPLTSLTLLRALRGDVIGEDQFGSEFNVFPSSRRVQSGEKSEVDAAATVLNVDIDEKAVAASRVLCRSLGKYASGMEFACASAGDAKLDLSEFDVVYMAALVGMSSETKTSLLESVVARMRPGALVVVRSCNDLKLCLYPELDLQTEDLIRRVDIRSIMHPYGQVVNSVIIGEIKT